MISAISMKEVKRKVNSAYFDDGLWDILLGIFIIMLALPGSFAPFISLLCYCAGYFVLKKVRQRVTYPRIGYMKITGNRKLAIIYLLGVVIFVLTPLFSYLSSYITGTCYVRSATNWPGWTYGYMKMLPYASIPVGIVFVAYLFRMKRWYLYTFLALLSIGLSGWLQQQYFYWFYVFAGLGAIIIVTGIGMFMRFLRNNPKVVEEELNEQTQNG